MRGVSLKHYLSKPDGSSHAKYLNNVRAAIIEVKQTADTISHANNLKRSDWRRLRVKIRHLDACIDLLKSINGFKNKNLIIRKLADLLKETSPVRDEEVLLITIPKKYRTPKLLRSLDERSLVNASSQRSLLKHVSETFNSEFIPSLDKSVMDPLSALSKKTFHRSTDHLIDKKRRSLKSMAWKVRKAKCDSKLIHKFRIRSKELRYLLKLVNPELRTKAKALEPVIEHNQDAFGRLHDINNAIKFVKSASPELNVPFREMLLRDLKQDRRGAFKLAIEKARILRRTL
jgi:CHAD domain-containing protein